MDEDEQICEDGIIERASDDDESDEDYGKKSSPRGKRKAKKDEEMHESDLEPEESDDDVQLDEFEPEDLS